MEHLQSLAFLTTREAITDTLYRAMISFDRHDVPLFNSAFTEDVVVEPISGGIPPMTGRSNLRTTILDFVGPMATTHSISNVRVNVKDGAKEASLTAYVLAQHCPPGRGVEAHGPKYLADAEYGMDVVRDDAEGLWKIKKWVPEILWAQGDASVVQPSG